MRKRFFNIISLNDPDQENIKKELITKYLWTELTLKIEQNELMRGKFKDRVQFLLEQRSEMLKMLSYSPGISLKFSNKHTQNVGVQIIDLLCNMVWRNGFKASRNASSSVKGLYKAILVDKGK